MIFDRIYSCLREYKSAHNPLGTSNNNIAKLYIAWTTAILAIVNPFSNNIKVKIEWGNAFVSEISIIEI